MPYEFFQIPSDDAGAEAERLNQFLNSHRVVKVEKQFFSDTANGYWSFCVSWLDGEAAAPAPSREKRVDYRELLQEDQFKVYSANSAINSG